MARFLARHGLVRLVGGRAVPLLLAWDLVVLADRARRIPVVDRGLRRGARAARRSVVGFGAATLGSGGIGRRGRRGSRSDRPGPSGR